jgi:site-specific recombinase XerD
LPEIHSAADLAKRQADYELIETAWLDQLRGRARVDATRARYRAILRSFFSWCQEQDKYLGSATPGDICSWRDEQLEKYSAATVHQRLAALRSFYQFCLESDLTRRNPAAGISCPAGRGDGPPRRQELTDSEVIALLDSCTPRRGGDLAKMEAARDRAILYVMAFTGVRTIEVHRADREDLQTRNGRAILWVWRKGRKRPDSYVVLPTPVEEPLREWLAVHPRGGLGPLFVSVSRRTRGQRLSTAAIRKMVKTRLRSCGIDDPTKTTHSLRHSAINRARRGGASVLGLREMTGHVRPETLLRYLADDDRLADPAEDRIKYGEDS